MVQRRRTPKPERYFRWSQKGERNIKRDARKRGSQTSTTGLNTKEWTPLLVAADRVRHAMGFIVTALTSEQAH